MSDLNPSISAIFIWKFLKGPTTWFVSSKLSRSRRAASAGHLPWIKGSGLAAELVIRGARATELNDELLKTTPTFPRLAPEAALYNVPSWSEPLPCRRRRYALANADVA
jgi:hypothetical protein